jgi:hypothetical protein
MTRFRLVPKERATEVSQGLEQTFTDLLKARTELEAAVTLANAALKRVDASITTIEALCGNFDPRKPYANPDYRGTGK